MSCELSLPCYHAKRDEGVLPLVFHVVLAVTLVVSTRRKPMWHDVVDIPWSDVVALTAVYHWEPSVALMLATATSGDCAAGDTRVE